jgi:hypothetical protein
MCHHSPKTTGVLTQGGPEIEVRLSGPLDEFVDQEGDLETRGFW